MRFAASKHPFFLAKHQSIPLAGTRVAAATVADPRSRQAKKRRSSGARRWRTAVASSDPEAGGGGEEDDEAGQQATGTPPRRRARLSARRRESVQLPDGVSSDGIGAFLRDPAGVESLLNTGALQSFAPGGSGPGTFTCTLRRIRLLGFEVAPVLDLRVVPTGTDCTAEMLSCRFEGSESVEQQNELFSGAEGRRENGGHVVAPSVAVQRSPEPAWRPSAWREAVADRVAEARATLRMLAERGEESRAPDVSR